VQQASRKLGFPLCPVAERHLARRRIQVACDDRSHSPVSKQIPLTISLETKRTGFRELVRGQRLQQSWEGSHVAIQIHPPHMDLAMCQLRRAVRRVPPPVAGTGAAMRCANAGQSRD